jgi:hypothetical protein
MSRWGQLAPSRDAERAAAKVFAPNLYRQSVQHGAALAAPLPAFDRIEFSSADVRAYLAQFELHTPFANARSL